ncbi:MAG: N-acetylmuramoyl-L-alanine amidase [Nitrospirae bacterium]|nr:N-acetylmuramoyl-L-alanine amidase [Nitrospirota bacterium]
MLTFLPSYLTASGKPSTNVIVPGKIEVKGIRYWSTSDYTRVVIDLSGTVEFSKNRISNPDRLYFDLMDTTIAREIKTSLPVGDGILKTVRAGQFKHDIVRVVLDLEEIADFNAFVLDDPARFVIDVYGKEKIKKPDTVIAKRKIVIDAGHGGHDPGAVGLRGLYEKDVVLDIALKLKKILLADKLNEVFLTRETDVFLPLEERTAIANKKGADLFVSIHANASPGRQARGIETYLLNWTDNEEAIRVAARENHISLKKMKAMHRQMDVMDIIKSDLIRQNKRDESIKLAHYIQKSMVSTMNSSHENILDLGVKQALFYVLFGARMPSVLVEVSFISNPEEERLLSSDSYRMQIAEAIAGGLNKYITSIPTVQKVAGVRGHNSH